MIEAWNTENKVPHLYHLTEVSPHMSTKPAQLYLESGTTGQSRMFFTECDEGLNMQDKASPVLSLPPPRGAASLIFCSPNISCAANLCALQWMDKFLIQPSTVGFQMPLSSCTFWLGPLFWSLISSQIVDLELSIWIPALPPSVGLKYWVTISPGQRTNPNSSFYPSPSSTLALLRDSGCGVAGHPFTHQEWAKLR